MSTRIYVSLPKLAYDDVTPRLNLCSAQISDYGTIVCIRFDLEEDIYMSARKSVKKHTFADMSENGEPSVRKQRVKKYMFVFNSVKPRETA